MHNRSLIGLSFTSKYKKKLPSVQKPGQSQKNIFETKVALILMHLCRFSRTAYLHHASELPNWDKSDKISKQITLVNFKDRRKNSKNFIFITLVTSMRT